MTDKQNYTQYVLLNISQGNNKKQKKDRRREECNESRDEIFKIRKKEKGRKQGKERSTRKKREI